MVHGAHQADGFATYLGELARVYALFSANSFYRQAVPDDSLDLGFSATAMHWLSAKPTDLSDHIHMVGASGDELRAFAEHAAQDWRTILIMSRARDETRCAIGAGKFLSR